MSDRSSEPLIRFLREHYRDVTLTIVNTASDLAGIAERHPDLVFLTVKAVPVDSQVESDTPKMVWVADFLDECRIAYTGSGSESHKLELEKPLGKQRIRDRGLATADYVVVRQNQPPPDYAHLGFPLFIKPTNRGGGQGVDAHSVVTSREEAESKIASIVRDHKADALLETYLKGREFSVAILRNEHGFDVMPLELTTAAEFAGTIMSAEMKSANTEIVLPVSDPVIRQAVSELALGAFHALGARDYGRIDIKLSETGVPHFLEANLIPSIIDDYGSFPKACLLNKQLRWDEMILRIVQLGLEKK